MNQYNTICLIVAAGSGARLGNEIPKQYLMLGNKPILRHSAEAFLNHPQIDAVCVIYNPAHQEFYDNAVGDLNLYRVAFKERVGVLGEEGASVGLLRAHRQDRCTTTSFKECNSVLLPPVAGGATRQESSRLGIEAIAKHNPKKVLIHDGARPFVDSRIITDIINALDETCAAIPALPVEDTIKEIENGRIIKTIPRENLFRAQTPQGFVYSEVRSGEHTSNFSLLTSHFTDDASIFEHLQKEVRIIPGSQNNFKITTTEDLQRGEILMSQNVETRVGMGFDAHKFCEPKMDENNFIMLCGVAVPHDKSLEGHSDADVGLHAAVDAILGAIAAGDIGTHFPPSDMQWKGADSSIFLAHAAKLLKERGGEIINIDITIICERPKILPHRDKMCGTIAKILGIEQSRVSVKATTTEGMGFTGRKEGIAAQAIVSIRIKE